MLQVDIHMNGEHVEQYQFPDIPMSEYMTQNVTPPSRVVETPLPGGDYSFRLEELAYTRSGDKGNSANIGNQLICIVKIRGNSFSQFIYWYKRWSVQTCYQDRVEIMIEVLCSIWNGSQVIFVFFHELRAFIQKNKYFFKVLYVLMYTCKYVMAILFVL